MRSREHWFKSHLREISQQECMELLNSREVGRVGFDDATGPLVIPVNYTVEDGAVLIATSPFSSLARCAPEHVVAFEVDEADAYTETGWSVVVRGRAEVVPYDELPDQEDRPSPWVEGTRTLHIRITPQELSGRRLFPA